MIVKHAVITDFNYRSLPLEFSHFEDKHLSFLGQEAVQQCSKSSAIDLSTKYSG
jgi:hypothetical protein